MSDTSEISKLDKLKIAFDLLKNEHPRWNQWILFFLGSQASLFFVFDKSKEYFQNSDSLFYYACGVGILLSLIWICVSLNLRASTRAWQQAIKKIEEGSPDGVWKIQQEYFDSFKRWEDFFDTLKFWKGSLYSKNTKILTLIGVIFVAIYLLLILMAWC